MILYLVYLEITVLKFKLLFHILYSNMCTYNAMSYHTDHFEIQKRDLEESLLTVVHLITIHQIPYNYKKPTT